MPPGKEGSVRKGRSSGLRVDPLIRRYALELTHPSASGKAPMGKAGANGKRRESVKDALQHPLGRCSGAWVDEGSSVSAVSGGSGGKRTDVEWGNEGSAVGAASAVSAGNRLETN
eukprot:3864472-Rhodomonas_salina.1